MIASHKAGESFLQIARLWLCGNAMLKKRGRMPDPKIRDLFLVQTQTPKIPCQNFPNCFAGFMETRRQKGH